MLFRPVHLATLAVIFIVAITVSGALYTQNLLKGDPEQAKIDIVLNHLSLMRNSDILEAYELGSDEFRFATTFREFSRFADRYDIFRTNTKIKVIAKVGASSANVELTGSDKQVTNLAYILVKENGAWRVTNITITLPQSIKQQIFDDSLTGQLGSTLPALTGYYDNAENRYSINFPERWNHERLDNGTLILSGMQGTRSYYSNINIQSVLTKKAGGRFKSVKSLIDDIKKQVLTLAKNPIFLETGPVIVNEKSGAKATGEYLIFSYTYKGNSYQQWNVVVSRDDGELFYVWAYTSPIKQYSNNLPLAKAILESWQIY